MSKRTLCDVCGESVGLIPMRLRVAGPVHPHRGEPVVEIEVIDACPLCLARVTDLATERTLEDLRRNWRTSVLETGH